MPDLFGANSGGEMLASPTPVNDIATSIPSQPQANNWLNLFKMLANSGGRGNGSVPFGPLGSSQYSPQPGVPLYSLPPIQPTEDDQQKQTSVGQAAEYAKIIAQLFA